MRTEVVVGGPSLRGWSHQLDMQTCPQRWAFRYLARALEEEVAEPLAQGTLVHAGLAQYWEFSRRQLYGEDHSRLMLPEDAVFQVAHAEDAHRMASGLEPGYRAHIAPCRQILKVYQELRPHDGFLETHGVEYPAELWMADGRVVAPPADAAERRAYAATGNWRAFYGCGAPWLATMRLDWLGRSRVSGKHMIVDWKTGMKLDTRKERGFGASGQFIGHVIWGSANYTDFDGAYVGFIHKKNIAAGNRKVNDIFPVFRAAVGPEAMRAFPMSVQYRSEQIARLLESAQPYNVWPRAFSEQGPCEDRYGPCGYMRACMFGA